MSYFVRPPVHIEVASSYKRLKLERQNNTEVIYCVIILLALCFIGAIHNCIQCLTLSVRQSAEVIENAQYIPLKKTVRKYLGSGLWMSSFDVTAPFLTKPIEEPQYTN